MHFNLFFRSNPLFSLLLSTVVLLCLAIDCSYSMTGSNALISPHSSNLYIDSNVAAPSVLISGAKTSPQNVFHIFTHGREGQLFIEGRWLDTDQFINWVETNQYLEGKDHLNIYGCNFANGESGPASVAYLALHLGVSVSASDDITGIDGDWILEVGDKPCSPIGSLAYAHNLQDCSLIDYTFCPPTSSTSNDGTITITNLQAAVPNANFWKVDYRSDECGLDWTPGFAWTNDFSNTTITGLSDCKYTLSVFIDDNTVLGIECNSTRLDADLGTVEVSVGSNSPVCPSTDLALSAYLKTGTTYMWTGPNGFVSTEAMPVISNFSSAEVGTYTVVVTDDCNNSYVGEVEVSEKQNCLCDCKDYLYVNDADNHLVHKFELSADGSIAQEIGTPWLDMGINAPHGLVSDLNGNLYIAQNDNGSGLTPQLNQISCDGTILDNSFQDMTGSGIVWEDIFNIGVNGTSLYTILSPFRDGNNGNVLVEMDLCDGSITNSYTLPDADYGAYWGFRLHDQGIYIVDGGFEGEPGFDFTLLNIDYNLNTLSTVFTYDSASSSEQWRYLGMDRDEFGNFYVATSNLTAGYASILKFDPQGNLIDEIRDYSNASIEGFFATWGLEYNKGFLYLSSRESCVYVIDSGGENGPMIELPDYTVPGTTDDFPKALNIVTECCPATTPQVVSNHVCATALTEDLRLNDIFECEGAVCEGEWVPSNTASADVYVPCDQIILANTAPGCYQYTKTSSGGGLKQCGSFSITFDLEIIETFPITLDGPSSPCINDDYIVSSTTAGVPTSYQWQMSSTSCTDGFSDIPGATLRFYESNATSADPIYLRLISTYGSSGCTDGSCDVISDCLVIIPQDCCPTDNCFEISINRN